MARGINREVEYQKSCGTEMDWDTKNKPRRMDQGLREARPERERDLVWLSLWYLGAYAKSSVPNFPKQIKGSPTLPLYIRLGMAFSTLVPNFPPPNPTFFPSLP